MRYHKYKLCEACRERGRHVPAELQLCGVWLCRDDIDRVDDRSRDEESLSRVRVAMLEASGFTVRR